MDREVTVQELENLEFRKKRLRRKLERLELLLSGGGANLFPLVRGEDGLWSEKRGRALIRDLVESLDMSLRGWMKEAEGSARLSQLSPELTQEQRELFESFLYCALRGLEVPPVRIWNGPADGTWEGLLAFAASTEYRDKYALYFSELYEGLSGFFGDMDQLYELLTDEEAVEKASPGDIETMRNLFHAEIARLDGMPVWEDLTEEEKLAFSEPYTEEDGAEERERKAALEQWRERFPEKETFCREYLRFRKLFFDEGAWRYLESWTERMVDLYLYRQGRSSFLADDTFFLAYGLLDRTERQLRSEVQEEG